MIYLSDITIIPFLITMSGWALFIIALLFLIDVYKSWAGYMKAKDEQVERLINYFENNNKKL